MQSARERVSLSTGRLSAGRLSAGRMEAERLFCGTLHGIFVRSNIFITQADSVKYLCIPSLCCGKLRRRMLKIILSHTEGVLYGSFHFGGILYNI